MIRPDPSAQTAGVGSRVGSSFGAGPRPSPAAGKFTELFLLDEATAFAADTALAPLPRGTTAFRRALARFHPAIPEPTPRRHLHGDRVAEIAASPAGRVGDLPRGVCSTKASCLFSSRPALDAVRYTARAADPEGTCWRPRDRSSRPPHGWTGAVPLLHPWREGMRRRAESAASLIRYEARSRADSERSCRSPRLAARSRVMPSSRPISSRSSLAGLGDT